VRAGDHDGVRIATLVLLVTALGCGSMQHGPIQEATFVRIGGIDQWVTIRGADRRNPVLLILHGGPGDAQSALRNTYGIYERLFIVVQWDQPGAGQTYGKNPTAQVVLIKGAGHFAIVTHREQFAAALESVVLPIAREADR
jgi:pimeloyl-ACP methyl ester carboxylesterase